MHVFLYSSRVGEVPKDVAGDGSGGLKTDDHEHGGAMTGPGGDGCDTESQGVAHRVAPWLGGTGERWRENWVREGGRGSPDVGQSGGMEPSERDGRPRAAFCVFLTREVLRGRH